MLHNDLAQEWMMNEEAPTRQGYEAMLARYPHHQRTLLRVGMDWAAMNWMDEVLPPAGPSDPEEDKAAVDRAMLRFRAAMTRHQRGRALRWALLRQGDA